jgi:hypothetical protein
MDVKTKCLCKRPCAPPTASSDVSSHDADTKTDSTRQVRWVRNCDIYCHAFLKYLATRDDIYVNHPPPTLPLTPYPLPLTPYPLPLTTYPSLSTSPVPSTLVQPPSSQFKHCEYH